VPHATSCKTACYSLKKKTTLAEHIITVWSTTAHINPVILKHGDTAAGNLVIGMALWKTVLNTTQLNFNYESQIRGQCDSKHAMDICLTYLASAPLGSTSRVAADNELHSAGAFIPQLLHSKTPPTDRRPLHCRTHHGQDQGRKENSQNSSTKPFQQYLMPSSSGQNSWKPGITVIKLVVLCLII
jgi:hypothetical protein